MPPVQYRVEAAAAYRNSSPREATRRLALTPTLFGENRQPKTEYLIVPKVSSSDRTFFAVGFMNPDVVATDLVLVVGNADLYLFGILSSLMHLSWIRNIGGRIKSDYRYSATITYNTFPFPVPSEIERNRIAVKAQAIIDARAHHHGTSLATLYNRIMMPPDLVEAHRALDRVIDRAYRAQPFPSDLERVRFLLTEYQRLN